MALAPQDAYDNVTLGVELARRECWRFGAKLVRGAYLAQERAHAAEIGYEDPINPTYEATNAMYHRCAALPRQETGPEGEAWRLTLSHPAGARRPQQEWQPRVSPGQNWYFLCFCVMCCFFKNIKVILLQI